MADIVSNALVRALHQEEVEVKKFLESAEINYATGDELAKAAAEHFKIEITAMEAAIEEYRHCNCTHEGGGGEGTLVASSAAGAFQPRAVQLKVSKFAEDVLVHVVLHEIGHGLVREFDLPILGNEETLADAFATHFLVTRMPDRATDVLQARVTSLMIEAGEVARDEWTVKGEHNSDARRAFQIAALAIAHDYQKYASVGKAAGMDEDDIRRARDYATEIHRSWRRILQPLFMPEGQLSGEARFRVDDGSSFSAAINSSSLSSELESIVKGFDWHSQVTVRFSPGDGGAGWSRSSRTVTVHDDYVARFVKQGHQAAKK